MARSDSSYGVEIPVTVFLFSRFVNLGCDL